MSSVIGQRGDPFGSHTTHQDAFLGLSQPHTVRGWGFCGSKIINPHLPTAVPPDRGTLSAVGRNEAKLYRETRGRQRFASGVVGPEEIWILKFGAQQHPSYLIT